MKMNEKTFTMHLEKEHVETKRCVICDDAILTAKGEAVLQTFAEADMSIDAGEFSSDHDYYDGFCQCDDIERVTK